MHHTLHVLDATGHPGIAPEKCLVSRDAIQIVVFTITIHPLLKTEME